MDAAPKIPSPKLDSAEELLLSSLADFWSLLEPLLIANQVRNVCEIGIGTGKFATILLGFCQKRFGNYSGIDPALDERIIPAQGSTAAQFYQQNSLSVLPTLPAHDAYFIDGDHNYYTVLNELRLILSAPDRWPLIILHDVGWPWGRRDQYCAPEAIPEAFRHAYSATLGVMPGREELGLGGFSGDASAYPYTAAAHTGGPRNGVLTAVEDFLHERTEDEWRLIIVPAVFGLGILYAPAKCSGEASKHLERLASSVVSLNPMLELMEHNRMDLVMAHLRNVKELGTIHGEYEKLNGSYELLANHTRDLQSEFERLHQQYVELEAHNKSLMVSYHDLLKHHDILNKNFFREVSGFPPPDKSQ